MLRNCACHTITEIVIMNALIEDVAKLYRVGFV